jgi:hypothetical protein
MADYKPASYVKALEMISCAKQANDASLELSGLGLTDLPPEIGSLTALKAAGLTD